MILKNNSKESNSELLAEYKKEFSAREGIHFNNAGRTPISRAAAEQISAAAFSSQTQASLADHEWMLKLSLFRKNLANFLDSELEDVAFVANVASGLSQAALGFPLTVSDEIVTLDQEYSSNFYPWKVAADRSGARFTVVSSGSAFANGDALTQKILESIRVGVKIVAISWVQFQTGAVLDLKLIGDKTHSVGAFLVVDGIQGLGQLPFSFRDLPVDFIAGGSHKWMCGPLGQGFFAVKKELRELLQPTVIGCGTFNRFGADADPNAAMELSARKFEPGGFAFVPLFGFNEAVKINTTVGMDVVAAEVFRLSQLLREGLMRLGVDVVSPFEQRSGITSIRLNVDQESALLVRCREEQIAIAKRGEFLRISIHAFCNDEEISKFLSVVEGVCC